MNKFEKLIEYIINDEDQKARELFHDIVVEKSRDIYESIIEQEEHGVAGDQVGEMVDEISAEESMHEEDDDSEEEFSLDDAGSDDSDGEVSGDLPAEEPGMDMGERPKRAKRI